MGCWHCTPLGVAAGINCCAGAEVPNQTYPGLFPALPNPGGTGSSGGGIGNPGRPNIDPTCFGVDCQPPVAQPPTGGGTGTGTGTNGQSTSPLDSLAAQLMGGGSGAGGGLTAAPVTVPAAAGGGIGLGVIVLVLAVAGLGWYLLRGRKGAGKAAAK